GVLIGNGGSGGTGATLGKAGIGGTGGVCWAWTALRPPPAPRPCTPCSRT
ncbi:hypothetical protein BIS44_2014, partial [Mycobacterium tuberculosis variant bovis BCG]